MAKVRRLLTAAGLAPGQTLSSAHGGSAQPLQAGGQSWRFATAGGDNNVRMWMVHPNVPSPAAIAAATGTSRPNPRGRNTCARWHVTLALLMSSASPLMVKC